MFLCLHGIMSQDLDDMFYSFLLPLLFWSLREIGFFPMTTAILDQKTSFLAILFSEEKPNTNVHFILYLYIYIC